MKKMISLCLAMVMCLSLVHIPQNGLVTSAYAEENTTDFGGGSGTEESPYKVSTPEHLNNVRNFLDAYFIQVNDIYMKAATSGGGEFYHKGQGWFGIGSYYTPFTGNYNGGGYSVKGLQSNTNGLFYDNDGTIQNLGMVDANLFGSSVGGIAQDNGGTISNCYNASNITSDSYDAVGGIVGGNSGTISNCYNTGNITGDIAAGSIVGNNFGIINNCYNSGEVSVLFSLYAGGIAGCNFEGTISNCYNTGNISSNSNAAGGITGPNAGTIRNCYNTGNISSSSSAGGIAGGNSGTTSNCYNIGSVLGSSTKTGGIAGGSNSGTTSNCYTLYDVSYNDSGTALTVDEMKTQINFVEFDFDDVWHYDNSTSYPFPTLRNIKHFGGYAEENTTDFEGGNGTFYYPYKISTPEHLDNVRYYDDAYFIQVNDIDLTELTSEDGDFDNDSKGWVPINWVPNNRKISTKFTGNYNGSGHSIIGLQSKRGGLFGFNYGTIQNLGMVDSNISDSSSDYAGGIVGYNEGTINNCYSTGNISVSSYSSDVGGIVGCNNGKINNCYNTGNISVSSSYSYAGGIAGYNNGTINNCYNTGGILVSYSYAGGIAASNSGTINNCYNTGDLSASGTGKAYVGGLVGYASGRNSTVSFGYSIGEVSSTATTSNVGKVIGCDFGATFSNLYYIGTSTDSGIGNEGNKNGAVEFRTEEQLKTQSSLTGFDFDTIWDISPNSNDGFPYLRSNLPTTTNKVALPKANPKSGAIATGTTVSLTTATDGATIRYTTDGTEPTATSTVYSTPISITEATTIKAKAFKEDLTDSDTATFNYTISQAGDMEISVTSIGYTVTNTGDAQSGRVIMTIYDESGKLVHTKQNDIETINTGTNDGVFENVNIPTEMINKYTVKLFLWTSDGKMVPLAKIPAELYF